MPSKSKDTGISGLSELKNMVKALRDRDNFLSSVNGSYYDASRDYTPKRDRLHTDSESMSAEESAIYAENNPEIEAHFQKMKNDLDQILGGIWKD